MAVRAEIDSRSPRSGVEPMIRHIKNNILTLARNNMTLIKLGLPPHDVRDAMDAYVKELMVLEQSPEGTTYQDIIDERAMRRTIIETNG
jgi:hypothetical protein